MNKHKSALDCLMDLFTESNSGTPITEAEKSSRKRAAEDWDKRQKEKNEQD
jgi:hypothetical protein